MSPWSPWHNRPVRVTAKVDYAVRAVALLAATPRDQGPVKGDAIAKAQAIPVKYLENILSELRQSGIVRSQRGAEGGYWLARAPEDVTVADVIRAVEGPIATVRGEAPEDVDYPAGAGALQEVWIATRAALRSVLEQVTMADVASGELPEAVAALVAAPTAWERGWMGRGS
jgi:Rrf2 family protein